MPGLHDMTMESYELEMKECDDVFSQPACLVETTSTGQLVFNDSLLEKVIITLIICYFIQPILRGLQHCISIKK